MSGTSCVSDARLVLGPAKLLSAGDIDAVPLHWGCPLSRHPRHSFVVRCNGVTRRTRLRRRGLPQIGTRLKSRAEKPLALSLRASGGDAWLLTLHVILAWPAWVREMLHQACGPNGPHGESMGRMAKILAERMIRAMRRLGWVFIRHSSRNTQAGWRDRRGILRRVIEPQTYRQHATLRRCCMAL